MPSYHRNDWRGQWAPPPALRAQSAGSACNVSEASTDATQNTIQAGILKMLLKSSSKDDIRNLKRLLSAALWLSKALYRTANRFNRLSIYFWKLGTRADRKTR